MAAISSSEDQRHATTLEDVEGEPTDHQRFWFRVEQIEITWLPVSESAFLLWVLALLVVVWLGIGAALGLVPW